MKEKSKSAVSPERTEYHQTREVSCVRRGDTRGGVKGVSPNGPRGARPVGAPRAGEMYADVTRMRRAGGGPLPGFELRGAGARRGKLAGWLRLLSHLFRNKRGFRSGVRAMGRLV